jgi:hypothetical protein
MNKSHDLVLLQKEEMASLGGAGILKQFNHFERDLVPNVINFPPE